MQFRLVSALIFFSIAMSFQGEGNAACIGSVISTDGTSATSVMSNTVPNAPFSSGAGKFVNGMDVNCNLLSAQPSLMDISGIGSMASQNSNNVNITGGTISGVSGLNGSGAELSISFQPGLITSISNTKGAFNKFVKASTVDNIVGSAIAYSCVGSPVATLYECGISTTCASPVTIGSVTISGSGTATPGTISNAAIAVGDYVGWAISGGTCVTLDMAATAQIHAN